MLVVLRNLIVISDEGGPFPAAQDIPGINPKTQQPCDVCPVETPCQRNNPFDCEVYAFFCGFYCDEPDTHGLASPWDIEGALKTAGAIVQEVDLDRPPPGQP